MTGDSNYTIRKESRLKRETEKSLEALRIAEHHKRLREEYYEREKHRQEKKRGIKDKGADAA